MNDHSCLDGVRPAAGRTLVFWQGFPSLLLSEFLAALAPGREVILACTGDITGARRALGWHAPEIPGVEISSVASRSEVDRLLNRYADAVHVVSGVRADPLLAHALKQAVMLGCRVGVFSEPYRDHGVAGLLRRILYRRLVRPFATSLDFVLGTGEKALGQYWRCGVPRDRLFEFSYFPERSQQLPGPDVGLHEGTRFVFVGALVRRKGVDILLRACRLVGDPSLRIVGDGPARSRLAALAGRLNLVNVEFVGTVPRKLMDPELDRADVLVLSSRFDGWGAVVNEAISRGLRVIVSSECGSSALAEGLGAGTVFPSCDVDALGECMRRELERGPRGLEARHEMMERARAVDPVIGARYLLDILAHREGRAPRPQPPWRTIEMSASAGSWHAPAT